LALQVLSNLIGRVEYTSADLYECKLSANALIADSAGLHAQQFCGFAIVQ